MIVAITGDHPRHHYVLRRLAETGLVSGWITESREAHVPEPDDSLTTELKGLFRLHFDRRAEAEHRFFGDPDAGAAADVDRLVTTPEDLNGAAVHRFLEAKAPRLIFAYGCHILSGETLRRSGQYAWNVHGGLSPWYRGAATHFWPSYLLEPQMTGVTLHEMTDVVDAGGIIHQTAVDLVPGDGLHDLSCRAVKTFADGLPEVVTRVLNRPGHVAGSPQKTSGRLWLGRAWRPEHLLLIYKLFDDRIVDHCLDGRLVGKLPKLKTVDDLSG